MGLRVLARIRRRALRAGVWFRVLDGVERGIVDLTLKCLAKVRSVLLARVLAEIARKLLEHIRERSFTHQAFKLGFAKAIASASIALSWGVKDALSWLQDRSYVILQGIYQLRPSLI